MRLFKKAAIIGVGLIGGSLALAIKKSGLAEKVVGVSRHKKSIDLARKRGAIDEGSLSLDIVKDADLLVFAAPVSVILKLAPEVSRIIKKECVVTDVGSTKKEIVSRLEKIFPGFIGSHPMSGSEKRGVAHANGGLFKDSICILTPTGKTKKGSSSKISLMWKSVGAKNIYLSPDAHDKILSCVSHLPHIAAFSLINAVPDGFLRFASSGLKDTTRIAASEDELWVDIFLSNRKNLLNAIKAFEGALSSIESAIKTNNRTRLAQILKKAKEKREKLG
ncbi:MAG: prephenate dehydrogenase [Candidatus Omnitrophica bacterium]|nr:prephenate dehydrogenase [Candidatus Omnitrophota bacterium]MBU1870033.1 prephenate dehydrogenase [Candidatus Omnitrophota bacterium]